MIREEGILGKLNRAPRKYYYVLKEPAYRFVSEKKIRITNQPMWAIDGFVGILALIALLTMSGEIIYVLAALLTGLMAFIFDYIIEYAGILNGKWEYPRSSEGFMRVPLEVPLMFFFGGILATFLLFLLSRPSLSNIISFQLFDVVSMPQLILITLAVIFILQYFAGIIKSLIFWAMPLSLAAYISYPEPWILVLAVLPVYIDYYLEKRLVPSNDISYEGYDEDVAINVAVSYFSVALLVFMFSVAMLELLV